MLWSCAAPKPLLDWRAFLSRFSGLLCLALLVFLILIEKESSPWFRSEVSRNTPHEIRRLVFRLWLLRARNGPPGPSSPRVGERLAATHETRLVESLETNVDLTKRTISIARSCSLIISSVISPRRTASAPDSAPRAHPTAHRALEGRHQVADRDAGGPSAIVRAIVLVPRSRVSERITETNGFNRQNSRLNHTFRRLHSAHRAAHRRRTAGGASVRLGSGRGRRVDRDPVDGRG